MTEIARVADWLDKVHADRDLSARCCRMAYALARAADERGFISSDALAKIARRDDAGAAAAEDVLGRLTDRLRQAADRRFSPHGVNGYASKRRHHAFSLRASQRLHQEACAAHGDADTNAFRGLPPAPDENPVRHDASAWCRRGCDRA
jgi:hypothetical protein